MMHGFIFIAYIGIMFLGLLNIVNGVFVAAATDMSRMDRETATMDSTAKHVQIVKLLRGVFKEFDKDESAVGALIYTDYSVTSCDTEIFRGIPNIQQQKKNDNLESPQRRRRPKAAATTYLLQK